MGFMDLLSLFTNTQSSTSITTAREAQSIIIGATLSGGNVNDPNSLVRVKWNLSCGRSNVTLEELEHVAWLKSPIVRIHGRAMKISPSQMHTAIKLLKEKETTMTVGRLLRMRLGIDSALSRIPLDSPEVDRLLSSAIESICKGKYPLLNQPSGFSGILRPYQVRGFSWLVNLRRWGLGACLADDMGLGKTPTSLSLIQHCWEHNEAKPVLVVCPISTLGNWISEAQRFTPDLTTVIHHGSNRVRSPSQLVELAAENDIVFCSYSLLSRDLSALRKVHWSGIFLDEAQYIKNPTTKIAKAARSLVSDYKVALTGTPIENHVGDLWSIWEFINPGALGTKKEFKDNYHYPIANHEPGAIEKLKNFITPFTLRRLKTDPTIAATLPDKIERTIQCNMTKEQEQLYDLVVDATFRKIRDDDGMERRGSILALLSYCKQIANSPAQYLKDGSELGKRSGKLNLFFDLINPVLSAGNKILVFTQFVVMGELLKRHLEKELKLKPLFLHGGSSRIQRDQMIRDFQAGKHEIFILSVKAGGVGINLTAANTVVHLDRWFNFAVEEQATDRAYRIGQKSNVQVYKFITKNTYEERIDDIITGKKKLAGQIVTSGEEWLCKLSNKELLELFRRK